MTIYFLFYSTHYQYEHFMKHLSSGWKGFKRGIDVIIRVENSWNLFIVIKMYWL